MAARAHLGATAYERVRIHHSAVADVCADINEHWGHAGDAAADVAAVANARAARDEANAAGEGELAEIVGGFIEKWLTAADVVGQHFDYLADAEAQQNTFFHPAIYAPTAG